MAVVPEQNGGSHGISVPPQNDEAEVAVLGTILLTEQALDQIFVDLKICLLYTSPSPRDS